MGFVIELIIVLVVLAVVGYCALYIVQKFGLPDPVRWLVGAILLIGLLIYAATLLGAGRPAGGPVFIKLGGP